MGQDVRWIKLILAIILILPSIVNADEKGPELNSEAAILIDAKTGEVLFEKKSHQQMYPASITKIVTGIMAVESGRLEEWAMTSKRARWAEGTRIYLALDESKPLKDLVYGLMMNSGNDAAIVIAEYLGGSVEQFAQMMNDFGTSTLGLKDTHFVNPHGLFHDDHYTTAYDMAIIAQYAMKNPAFREIVKTQKRPWHGQEWESSLVNHNKLLWRYEGTTGIKNGYFAKAGNTLVTSASRGGTELIAVCLKAQGSEKVYKDTIALLDYGFTHFETKRLFSKGKKVSDSMGVEYETVQDLYVTVQKGHVPHLLVNHRGEVTIQTDLQEKSLSGLLKPVVKEIPDQAYKIGLQAAVKPTRIFEKFAVLFGTIIIVIIGFILYKLKRGSQQPNITNSNRDSGTA